MPRLLRDSPLNSIWEGSGNVAALDVLRAMAREPDGLPAFLGEVERRPPAPTRAWTPTSEALKERLAALAGGADPQFGGAQRGRGHGPGAAGLAAGAPRAAAPSPTRSAPRAWPATVAARSARCPPGTDARGDRRPRAGGVSTRSPTSGDGRVARITLDRPERGNGITMAMPRELADASSGPTSTPPCT